MHELVYFHLISWQSCDFDFWKTSSPRTPVLSGSLLNFVHRHSHFSIDSLTILLFEYFYSSSEANLEGRKCSPFFLLQYNRNYCLPRKHLSYFPWNSSITKLLMNPDPNHFPRPWTLSKVNHSRSQVCWCGLAVNQFISVKCKPSLRVTALGIRTLLSLFIEALLGAGGNFRRLPSCFHSNKHIGGNHLLPPLDTAASGCKKQNWCCH